MTKREGQPFWGSTDLDKKLQLFKDYYNLERTHQGLGGKTPNSDIGTERQTTARLDNYGWKSCCRGLYQLPIVA